MSRLSIVVVVLCSLLVAACGPSQAVVRRQVIQARQASNAGDYQLAASYWGRVIRLGSLTDQQELEAYSNRAYAYYAMGRYQQALKDYGKALDIDPKNADIYARQAEVYTALGNQAQALANRNRAAELQPNPPGADTSRVATSGTAAGPRPAAQDKQLVTPANPQEAATYASQGQEYYNQRRYSEALQSYNEALRLDPQLPRLYAQRGAVYGKLYQYQRAFSDFVQALRMNPNDATVYSERGALNALMGRNQEALDDYNRALQLQPNSAQTLSNRSKLYQALGQPERAQQDLSAVQGLAPAAGREFRGGPYPTVFH